MKKQTLAVLIMALFACCFSTIIQAADEYTLLKIDHNKGLSHSAILSLYQDDLGLMWLGTYDGLDNYDGRTMEVYRTEGMGKNQLLNNVIYGVSGADEDCLWISTNKGVNRFSLKKRCVTDSYELFSDFRLFSNRKGYTWVQDQNSIYWYNAHDRNFHKVYTSDKSFDRELSFVDDKDYLWIFSSEDNSVYRLQMNGQGKCTPTRVNIHPERMVYASYQSGILSFVDEKMDLFLFDIDRNTKIYIRNIAPLVKEYGHIKGIISYYDDIVIAFIQNGLMKLEAANHYQESFIDRNLRIFSIYKDPVQNTIWVGTDGQGVAIYSKKHSMAMHWMFGQMQGKITRQVRSIYTDSIGNLWFGTKGDGLVKIEHYDEGGKEELSLASAFVYFPGSKRTLQNYERGGTEFQVFGIIPSRYGKRLWIGSADQPGLSYYDYQRDVVTSLKGNTEKLEKVHWLYEENDSILWVTTSGNGICKIVIGKEKDGTLSARHIRQFIFRSDDGKEVSDFFPMCPEGDSLLWLGSRGKGLVKFNIHTECYNIYQPNKGGKYSTNDILSIYHKGDIFYLGTVSGLVRMTFNKEKQPEFSCIGKEQGFLNDMIHGILEDEEGFLWLSTNKGLVKYNPANNVFHTYYYSNGLQVGEFSDDAFHKCLYTGRLFFGGINGLLYLKKEGTNEADFYSDICFRHLTLGVEPVNFYDYYDESSNTLVLKGTHVSFSLSFVAPNFVQEDNFEYSYRLVGGEEDAWSPFSSESVATFKELPYGDYTLQIQYKKDVFDSEYPSYSLHIKILPPWYLSLWAWIAYVVLGGAVIFYAVWMMRKYYVREKLIKELMKHETGVSWNVNMSLSNYLPENNLSYQQVCIKEVSDSILHRLVEENQKEAAEMNIQVELDDGLCVMLPSYIMDYVLHFLYTEAIRKRLSAKLSGFMEEDSLVLLWEVPASYADSLLAMDGEKILSESECNDFNTCLHWWLYVYAVRNAQVSIMRDDQGRGICLRFSVQKEKEQLPAERVRKKVLLLENKIEIARLAENILSDDYIVYCVHTVKDAFDYLRQEFPDVFLADTLIYLNKEQKFMEYVEANKGLLARTAFVLMLTWKAADLLHRRFRNLVDGFVVMPFSLLFLHDIVDMAVRRVSDDKNMLLIHLAEQSVMKKVIYELPEQTDFMKKLTEIVDENLDVEELGASFLAEKMFMSPRQFYRKFKEIYGNAPTDFIKNYRLDKAARLLVETDLSIAEVVSEVGIVSRSYFYKEFFYKFGVTPKEYRELSMKQK